jgi:hypothetical protein
VRSGLIRTAPALAVFLVFTGFVFLWFAAPDLYIALLSRAGFGLTRPPLNDARAIVLACSCWRDGVNVYVPSACMRGGVYNYSPFLLRLSGVLPLPASAGMAAGIVLDGLFVASLCWLPPARTRAELALRIAATCSGSVLFVLERGNLDTGMFALAVLGIRLIERDSVAGLVGYALFLLGAACKFYPVALLLVILRERPRRILLLALPWLLVLLGYAETFNGVFGALNLPFGLWLFGAAHTLTPTLAQFTAAVSFSWLPLGMQLCTEGRAIILLLAALRVAPAWMRTFQSLGEEQSLFLIGGAVVMVLCFFMAQNIAYRGIFLLLVPTGMYRMAAAGVAGMRVACAAVFFLLWQGACLRAVHILTAGWPSPAAEGGRFLFWLISDCLVGSRFCAHVHDCLFSQAAAAGMADLGADAARPIVRARHHRYHQSMRVIATSVGEHGNVISTRDERGLETTIWA